MTEADLPWLHMVCAKRYPKDRFDPMGTEGWYRNVVLKSPMLFCPLRTDNAFTIAMLCCVPWEPATFECNIIMICADDGGMWEALRLLRVTVEWAKLRKCTSWRLTSENADVTALARRLGATETSPRFQMRL